MKKEGALDPGAAEAMAGMNRAKLTHALADQPGRDGRLSVLVVDDFTSSGGSLASAKKLIEAAILGKGPEPDVRTVVSRYTTAQRHDQLGEGLANPIDDMVGASGAGTRAELKARMDEDMEPFLTADQGWMQTGPEGVTLALA